MLGGMLFICSLSNIKWLNYWTTNIYTDYFIPFFYLNYYLYGSCADNRRVSFAIMLPSSLQKKWKKKNFFNHRLDIIEVVISCEHGGLNILLSFIINMFFFECLSSLLCIKIVKQYIYIYISKNEKKNRIITFCWNLFFIILHFWFYIQGRCKDSCILKMTLTNYKLW